MNGYGPLRLPELRWLCGQRGLTPYGRKRELLARLEEQDAADAAVPHAECFAPGLEPFRELEQLAEEARTGRGSLGAVPALPLDGANSSAPEVAPAQAKSAPAQAKSATLPPWPSIPLPRPEKSDNLPTDDETFRGFAEFFAMQNGQGDWPNGKYRDFLRSVSGVLQPDLLSSASSRPSSSLAATAAAATAACAACTTDVILRQSNLKDQAPHVDVPKATNSEDTWSSEMWRKCMGLIDDHLQICHLQMKHDALTEELVAINKAAIEKAEQLEETKEELDKLLERDTTQRKRLLGRTRLQFSAWLEKSENETEELCQPDVDFSEDATDG